MHVNPGKLAVREEAPWVGPQVDDRTEHVPLLVQDKLAVPPGPVQVVVTVATFPLTFPVAGVQFAPARTGMVRT
jgi:hypothetical protein